MSSSNIAPPLAGNVIASAGEGFVVAEWKDEGGPPGPPRWIAPLHLHRHDDEAWYVLEGTLCVCKGNDEIQAGAGAAVLVPRGVPHTYRNVGPGRLRYLLVMTSNIYRLIQAIHATQDRTSTAMRALFEKYDSELVEG